MSYTALVTKKYKLTVCLCEDHEDMKATLRQDVLFYSRVTKWEVESNMADKSGNYPPERLVTVISQAKSFTT